MIFRKLRKLKAYIRKKKETRFLKKHGVSSWRSYNLKYDPDYNDRAYSVRSMYHGYPYIAQITSAGALAKPASDVVTDGYIYLRDWLDTSCKGKARASIERTIEITTRDANGSVLHTDWARNDISGRDTVFVAFQNERDYLMFLLKWETS